jgi:hypothetical protein
LPEGVNYNLAWTKHHRRRLVVDDPPITQHAEKLVRDNGRTATCFDEPPTRLKVTLHSALIDIVYIKPSALQPPTEVSNDA